MSKARTFAVENHLARIARQPGGRRIADAVKAAETRVEGARESSIAALTDKAEELSACAANGRRDGSSDVFAEIYERSNAIYGLAAAFGLKPLAEAAFSLCDVADSYRNGEAAHWPAVDVHVDGIRLLVAMGPKANAKATEPILEGLRRVRARVLPEDQSS